MLLGCQTQTSAHEPACNNAGFLAARAARVSGTVSGDTLVDVCGRVARVRSARQTRSGRHGYFYVAIPRGQPIEIVSNLDAMAQSAAAPPAWPWVAPGDFVYVRGRYYYDDPQSQGIDWTEGDTGRSWPYPGYVAVCRSAAKACTTYR
jgi:hypothetical protein